MKKKKRKTKAALSQNFSKTLKNLVKILLKLRKFKSGYDGIIAEFPKSPKNFLKIPSKCEEI